MYEGDSFFTLSHIGQSGLISLSAILALISLLTVWKFSGGWRGIAVAGVVFYAFVALSPQIYYTYYHVIFPDLPRQWVIRPFVALGQMPDILSFAGEKTLSAHAQAGLGWLLFCVAFWRR